MPTSPRPASIRCTWLEEADGFAIDIDGTLIRGPAATAGAAALLERVADRFVLVSNNSSDTASALAARLAGYGLTVAPDRLVLAGETAVRRVARYHGGARVLMLASAGLRRLARSLGIEPVADDPEIVLLARDAAFSYRRLCAAANALRHGARLVVTNPDGFHPAPGRKVVPETGALMHALVHASGVRPHEIVGKPGPILFKHALRRLGTRPERTVVIGDNPATDAAGAVRLGMAYLIVGDAAEAVASTPGDLLSFRGGPLTGLPGSAQTRLIDRTSKVRAMVATDSE